MTEDKKDESPPGGGAQDVIKNSEKNNKNLNCLFIEIPLKKIFFILYKSTIINRKSYIFN